MQNVEPAVKTVSGLHGVSETGGGRGRDGAWEEDEAFVEQRKAVCFNPCARSIGEKYALRNTSKLWAGHLTVVGEEWRPNAGRRGRLCAMKEVVEGCERSWEEAKGKLEDRKESLEVLNRQIDEKEDNRWRG